MVLRVAIVAAVTALLAPAVASAAIPGDYVLTLSGTQTVRLTESSSWQVSQAVGSELISCTYDRTSIGRATYRFTTPTPVRATRRHEFRLRVSGEGTFVRTWTLAAGQDPRCAPKPLNDTPEAPRLNDIDEDCSVRGKPSRVRFADGPRAFRFRSLGDGEVGDDVFEVCHQLGPMAGLDIAIQRRYAKRRFNRRIVTFAGRSLRDLDVPDLDAVPGDVARTDRTQWTARFMRR